MNFFVEYMKNRKKLFFWLLFFTLLSSVVSIPIPYLSKYLIDVVLIEKQYNRIWIYLIVVAVIIVVQLITGRVTVRLSANFFQGFLFEIRKKIFKNSFNTSYKDQSSFSTVVFNDSELYANSVQQIITTILTNAFTGIAYILVMLNINWRLSLGTFLFIPVYIIWIMYVSSKLSVLSKKQQNAKDGLLFSINSATSNLEVIKIYKFTKFVIDSFNSVIDKNKQLNIKASIYQNFINIVAGIIITIASIVPFIIGINLVKNGSITIGSLVAFNSYSSLLFVPLTQLISIISTIKISNVYKSRIQYFTTEEGILEEVSIPRVEKIVINNLNLYTNNTLVLENVNLTLYSGKWVRFFGTNGSGKSLFLRSIAKLYTDYTGEIILEASNNKLIRLDENICIRPNKIIYVSNKQNFPLNNLFEEFTIGNKITNDEISDVLNIVGIGDKISTLPNGLYTSNDKVQDEFSTGEVQKIRLVRALVRKPDFLFLDEILSNIEPIQSIQILENIRQKYPDISLIVVEHHFADNGLFNEQMSIIQNEIIQDGIW